MTGLGGGAGFAIGDGWDCVGGDGDAAGGGEVMRDRRVFGGFTAAESVAEAF